jgi:hypothetical protein
VYGKVKHDQDEEVGEAAGETKHFLSEVWVSEMLSTNAGCFLNDIDNLLAAPLHSAEGLKFHHVGLVHLIS